MHGLTQGAGEAACKPPPFSQGPFQGPPRWDGRLTSVEPVFFNFGIVLILQKSCGGVAEFLHVPHPVSYYRDCGAFVLINEPILAHYSEYLVQIIFIFP